jgi:hypothetical protein
MTLLFRASQMPKKTPDETMLNLFGPENVFTTDEEVREEEEEVFDNFFEKISPHEIIKVPSPLKEAPAKTAVSPPTVSKAPSPAKTAVSASKENAPNVDAAEEERVLQITAPPVDFFAGRISKRGVIDIEEAVRQKEIVEMTRQVNEAYKSVPIMLSEVIVPPPQPPRSHSPPPRFNLDTNLADKIINDSDKMLKGIQETLRVAEVAPENPDKVRNILQEILRESHKPAGDEQQGGGDETADKQRDRMRQNILNMLNDANESGDSDSILDNFLNTFLGMILDTNSLSLVETQAFYMINMVTNYFTSMVTSVFGVQIEKNDAQLLNRALSQVFYLTLADKITAIILTTTDNKDDKSFKIYVSLFAILPVCIRILVKNKRRKNARAISPTVDSYHNSPVRLQHRSPPLSIIRQDSFFEQQQQPRIVKSSKRGNFPAMASPPTLQSRKRIKLY